MNQSINQTLCRASIVLMFALPCLVQAQTNRPTQQCGGRVTFVYHVNGIYAKEGENDRQGARKSNRLIKEAYKSSLEMKYRNAQDPSQNEQFMFMLEYNPTQLDDIVEVFVQKYNEMGMSAHTELTPYALFYALEALGFAGASPLPIPLALASELINTIRNAKIRYINSIQSRVDVRTTVIRNKVEGDLQEGRRVLLIPHSQGNLYVNAAIAPLLSQYRNSIGILGVASPAVALADGATDSPSGLLRYITAYDDVVINGLRVLTGNVLPVNVRNDPSILPFDRELLNHYFYESYFDSGLASRMRMNGAMDNYFPGPDASSGIRYPTPTLSSGPITVQLKWGRKPDVDLHIYEPNSTHVYYQRQQGTSGRLDRDDTDRFGPEHYFVACDTLEVGTYRVGVNYFSGSGPETARIQITTGDGRTRNYTQTLTTSRGGDGDNSPIIVATIIVARDANGRYTYTVRGS